MDEADDRPGSASDRVVDRNETYEHDKHGLVTVTGIWKGVEQVDAAHHTDQKDTIIVRYSTKENGEQVDELTDTIDEFIEATD